MKQRSTSRLYRAFALALLMGSPAWVVAGAPPTLQLGVTEPNSVNESNRSAYVTWDADASCVYKVQSRTHLTAGASWTTEEPVRGTTNGPILWSSPEALKRSEFYRLLLEPEIAGVEPAVVDPASSDTLVYILGHCLPSNALVRVGELYFTPTLVNSGGVWGYVTLNGLPPGVPFQDLAVVDAATGMAVALLPNALQTSPGVSQQVLEPPQEPPASPTAAFLSKKGYDYYQVRSESAAAGLQRLGGDILIHGDSDAVVYEIQEGKKGLNAVNVRLARMAGGGDTDEDCGGGSMRRYHDMPKSIIQNVRARTAPPGGGGGVLPHSGEVQWRDADLLIPGRGLDFIWARTYRSRTGANTAMGNRWSHSYDVSVEQDPSGIAVHDGTGRRDVYFPGADGLYSRAEFFNAGALSNETFALAFPDTGRWEFNPFGVSPAAGKLARIVDRNGNVMTFAYDGSGRLTDIVDTLGRTNTVAYDTAGRVASLTDFSGRTVTYDYYSALDTDGGDGDLRSVTSPVVTGTPNGNDFPDGKTTVYTYSTGFADERENHLLLSVTDPKGQTSHAFVYQHNQTDLEFLRCVSAQCGTDTPSCYRWAVLSAPPGRPSTLTCFANDPMGNVTEGSFDSRNRCVMRREFTGRAEPGLPVTDALNRPTGKLRDDDPDFYETRWTWNDDSLCTLVTYPGGNATACIYEREFDKNASPRKKGDLRVLRELASGSGADTDGDGVPDTTELTTTFQHDPRFGSPPTGRGKKLYVGINETLPYATLHSRKGWDGTIKGLIPDEDCDGFVVSSTDPRGNVTTANYDVRGNCVRVDDGVPVVTGGGYKILRFAYDSHGQCTAITNAPDANGLRRVDTFSYSQGQVAERVVDAGAGGLALATALEYDARGNVTRCVDPRGFDTLYTYNALDQTIARQTQQSSFGERTTTSFTYDANDNLVRRDTDNRDRNDALDPLNPAWTTLYEYDVRDRCTEVASEIAETHYATHRFEYDGNGQLVAVQSPEAVAGRDPHAIVTVQYDERGLLFRATAAPGTSTQSTDQYDYDLNGSKVLLIGGLERPAGATRTRYAYDGFGRPLSVTDAMGNVATCAFDRNGNLVYARCDGEISDVAGSAGNRRLAETRCQYDALDRLVRCSDSFFDIFTEISISDGAATSTFAYAPNGQLLSATDDNGHTTTYAYDTADRVYKIAVPANKSHRVCARDQAGNVTAVIQTDTSDLGGPQQVFATTYRYDPLNRRVACADSAGNTNRYFYDSRGNVVREIDPRGMVTGSIYDGLSRASVLQADADGDGEFTSPEDIVTSRAWDDNSRLLACTDGNTNTARYAYDARDRCVAITNADATTRQLVWSPRSNLVGEEDANGTVISNSFDLLDRCVRRDISPAAGVAATTTFETFAYDGLSRLVAASNDASHVEFRYDSLGNRTGGLQDGFAHAATHDGVGNLLSLAYPSGRIATYSYDSLDRVANVATASGGVSHPQLARFAYDGPGRLARIGLDNGIDARLDWDGRVSPPNGQGDYGWQQVSRVRHGAAGAPSSVCDISSTYSRSQSKLTKADAGRARGTALAYDALDRLVESTVSSSGVPVLATSYALDRNGNRQQVAANGVAGPYTMDDTPPEPADFQMDQYTVTPFAAEQHDRNGNLVAASGLDVTNYYTYDYADRLVGVDRVAAESSTESFTYDALGRRIASVSEAKPMAPKETRFLYGDDDCEGLLEVHGDAGLSEVFVHVSGLKDEIRENDSVRVGFTGPGEAQYFHCDELGSVLALTDAGGNVMERYDYDDYGTPQFLAADGSPLVGSDGLPVTKSPAGNPFLFRGMFWNGETGLYFGRDHVATSGKRYDTDPYVEDRRRVYDPKTGRYLLRAGVPVRPGANAFAFAGNNPWTGGAPRAMKKGTVKFFNETKGFGRAAGGGGGDPFLALDAKRLELLSPTQVRTGVVIRQERFASFYHS